MSLKKLPSNNTRRTDSKQAQVLAMLHSKQGATIATIVSDIPTKRKRRPGRKAA